MLKRVFLSVEIARFFFAAPNYKVTATLSACVPHGHTWSQISIIGPSFYLLLLHHLPHGHMWSEIGMVNLVFWSFQLLLHHLLNFVINCLLKMCQSLIFRKFDRYFCGTAQKKRLKDKFVLRSEFLSCLAGLEILELEKFQLRRLHVFALKRSTSANIPPSLSNLAHVSFEMSNL